MFSIDRPRVETKCFLSVSNYCLCHECPIFTTKRGFLFSIKRPRVEKRNVFCQFQNISRMSTKYANFACKTFLIKVFLPTLLIVIYILLTFLCKNIFKYSRRLRAFAGCSTCIMQQTKFNFKLVH